MEHSEKQEIRRVLDTAKMIKTSLILRNRQIENYLEYQESKLYEKGAFLSHFGKCCNKGIRIKKGFRVAFDRLTKLEKAKFYLMNLKITEEILNDKQMSMSSLGHRSSKQYQWNQSMQVLIKQKRKKKWNESKLTIYSKQSILKVDSTDTEIDLENCIIRKSQGIDNQALIFVLINTPKLIQIRMKASIVSDFNPKILKHWEKAQFFKIKKMMAPETNHKKMESNIEEEEREKMIPGFMEKTIKKMNSQQSVISSNRSYQKIKRELQSQIDQIKRQVLSPDFITGLSTTNGFKQEQENVYYSRDGLTVRKIFTFSEEISEQMLLLFISDIHHTRKRKPSLQRIKMVDSLPIQEAAIFYQTQTYDEQRVQFCYFRHFFKHKGASYYLEKSVDTQKFGLSNQNGSRCIIGSIEYCLWRVKSMQQGLQLVVEAKIKYSPRVRDVQGVTSEFIGEFVDYINTKCMSSQILDFCSFDTNDFENQYVSQFSSDSEDEFLTVTGSLGSSSIINDQKLKSLSLLQKKNSNMTKIQEMSIQPEQIQNQINNINILMHKYQQVPAQKGKPSYYNKQSGHRILGEDWKFDKEGAIVHLNIEKLKVQSSILKLVFQKIGRNLLTGKSILNVSLPVQVFYDQSNLQILAKGYRYGPRFLEPASTNDDPVQRIKNILCFKVGFMFTQIIMEKPFNPILGETYQGIVDGCPIYGEQISHHPPISSIYMVGRGYRIFGNLQAKVHIGINSATGGNEGYQHLIFDKFPGQVIFNSAPASLYGLLYGERKVICNNKSYIVDEYNRLFVEIKWGKNKTGKSPHKDYQDYFGGKIVKIKPGIDLKKPDKIKSSNYETEYGELYGRLSDGVYYEGQKIYTIEQDFGNNAIDYEPCLQSDCRNRSDLIMRRINDFTRAQEEKERLEEIQRRDRKLRAEHKH